MISLHPALLAQSLFGHWPWPPPPPYFGPTLYALLPVSGPSSGGNYVLLFGQGLRNVTQVTFDNVPATIVYQGGGFGDGTGGMGGLDDGGEGPDYDRGPFDHGPHDHGPHDHGHDHYGSGFLLVVIAPAHAPGTVAVTATNYNGTSNPLSYTYLATPLLPAEGAVPNAALPQAGAQPSGTLAISPASSPVAGGGTFTITGSNLDSVIGVEFNDSFAVLSAVSPTEITGTIPRGTAGPATVSLVTLSGKVDLPANSFSYT